MSKIDCVCNNCKKDIVVSGFKRKFVARIDNVDIFEVYFDCKYCKECFHVIYSNVEIDDIQKKIDKTKAIISGIEQNKYYTEKAKLLKCNKLRIELDVLLESKRSKIEELELKVKK